MEPTGRRSEDPAELLAHLGWVQRLARGLVEDAASAEDVAQEAFRVTLAQPPGRVGSAGALRAWLKSVTRKVAFDLFRSERSRRRREQSVARPEGSPDAFEVVERSARQERVAAAVRALPEPYRSTVLYRYLDELTTREVAQRMGVSEEAVRQRLSRGLARLREELDREFGSKTRIWAVALLAPALQRPAEAGVATAGALPITGALTMGAKTILAAGAVAALAVTVAVWRGAGTSAVDPSGDGLARSTTPAVARAAETQETGSSPPTRVVPRTVAAGTLDSARPAPDGEGTILRVRVVDPSGRVLEAGHLTCRWDEEPRLEGRDSARFLGEPVRGAVTEIELPARAVEAQIAASVEGFPPAEPVRVSDLRGRNPALPTAGVVTRDVEVHVGLPAQGPTLSGRVLVDGVPRIPLGLVVRYEGPPHRQFARIHSIDSQYAVGPLQPTQDTLWVTSEETVPRKIAFPAPEGDRTLDLELNSGRTLRLTVLDDRTGVPLAGREFYRGVSLVTDRTLRQHMWRTHYLHVTTNERGECLLRGLPLEGRLDLHRDASTREVEYRLVDGRTLKSRALSDPIWTLELTADMPAHLERTVRLRAEVTRATVFGSLPGEFLGTDALGAPLQVIYAAVREDRRGDVRDHATLRPDGRWEFSAETESKYEVWIERGAAPISRVVRVEVAGGDTGPIDLPPLPSENVALRLTHCPVGETARVFVEGAETGHPSPPIRLLEETTLHRLRLDGPRWIFLVCGRGDASSEAGVRRRVHVDPAKTSEVEIDLRGTEARPIAVEITGAPAGGEGLLSLYRLEGPDPSVTHVLVETRAGRSEREVVVPPGLYLFGYRGGFEGVAAGVVDSRALRPGEPLVLRAAVQAHARESLGRGVQFDAVDGVDLARLPLPARQFRWGRESSDPPRAEVYLPAGCSFTVLRDG
ncbi:MAG: RNA polymerase sigma factor [Planctomycetes bacterium]|nr:RNA polymerase sigma factor [Planctomycetota bacterium]